MASLSTTQQKPATERRRRLRTLDQGKHLRGALTETNVGRKALDWRSSAYGSADADDLRVEQIAAQLEEAEQQRLTDYWLKEQQGLADDLTEGNEDDAILDPRPPRPGRPRRRQAQPARRHAHHDHPAVSARHDHHTATARYADRHPAKGNGGGSATAITVKKK